MVAALTTIGISIIPPKNSSSQMPQGITKKGDVVELAREINRLSSETKSLMDQSKSVVKSASEVYSLTMQIDSLMALLEKHKAKPSRQKVKVITVPYPVVVTDTIVKEVSTKNIDVWVFPPPKYGGDIERKWYRDPNADGYWYRLFKKEKQ